MLRPLSLASLLLLQTANFAAAQWTTAVIGGKTVSWGGPSGTSPVVTAPVSGNPATFTLGPTPAPGGPPTRSFEPPPQPTSPSKAPTHPAPSHSVKPHKPHKPHKPQHKSHKKHKTVPTPHPSPSHTPNRHGSGSSPSGGSGVTNGGAAGQTATPQSNSTDTGPNRSLVIGLAVGFTLIALIIIAVVAFFVMRRRKARGYASAASSINEEAKIDPTPQDNTPAPFAPDAQPTLPAVMALASARNSTASLGTNDDNRVSMAASEMQVSTPWVPKTRSRLSQLQQIQHPASPPPTHHNIPRRPVGASSP